MPPKSTRNELMLKHKVELIKNSEGKFHRVLAKQDFLFGCGRTQVGNILKKKAEYLSAYEENEDSDWKQHCNGSSYNDVDLLIWEWFQHARSLNMPVSGTMIQEKALEFTKQLNKPDFKASNGWLGRFKGRHNIAFSAVSREKGCVDGDVVEDWKLKLPDIIARYQPKDIYNMDESGCVKHALPTKTLAVCGEDHHVTVLNMAGDFEKTLIIGRSAKPHCFRNIDINQLLNKRAWMTSTIFIEWITQFNRKMCRQDRHALLFLDNASAHPHDLLIYLFTLKFIFFKTN
uniref:HTH CENPB-type domain-containing protein n=1 Tax=Latimeria chalumnae TaxID=7897 RepID=H3A6Q7_LATCH